MNIIEKIEIKNFRSFGNRKKEKTIIKNISDLNIFSGANDSGKSNILRALNLFFKGNTNLGEFFDFSTDFFKKSELDEEDIKEELVTIKLHFLNKRNKGKDRPEKDQHLPEKFWVARKWRKNSTFSRYTQADGVLGSFKREKGENYTHFVENGEIKKIVKANLARKLTNFLSSIQYHYIPAIKDKSYFAHLYGEMQQSLLKGKSSNLDSKKNAFQQAIQDDTTSLMNEFKSVVNGGQVNIEAVFELPNLINLFQSLKVQTGQVNLISRGDGLQAKLIPEILNFISVKERSFTSKTIKPGEKAKKFFIWGFEEPENSYEYKNAQILANKFKDSLSDNAQIFLTTHSFNFLTINGDNTSTYRVWKDNEIESSRVTRIKKGSQGEFTIEGSTDSDRLREELGVFTLNAELEKVFEETELLKLVLKDKLAELEQSQNILLVEDEYFEIYQIAWMKINQVECNQQNFKAKFDEEAPFKITSGKSAGGVSGILRSQSNEHFEGKKIIGLFDFDKAGHENFHNLYKTVKENQIWPKEVAGDKRTGHYKKRKDHEHIYTLLLPVPDRLKDLADLDYANFSSYIEVENLLPIEFLITNNFVDEKVAAGNVRYFKCKKTVKDRLWKKLFDLDPSQFTDFQPLFTKVYDFFQITETNDQTDVEEEPQPEIELEGFLT